MKIMNSNQDEVQMRQHAESTGSEDIGSWERGTKSPEPAQAPPRSSSPDLATQWGLRASARHSDKCPAVQLGWETCPTINRMSPEHSLYTPQALMNEEAFLCWVRCPEGFTPAGMGGNQATKVSASPHGGDSGTWKVKWQHLI